MRVILGVDDSPFSEAAIQHVAQTAWPKGTTILVVSAAGPGFLGPGEIMAPQAIADLIEQQQKYHQDIAERAVTRLRQAGLDARARMAPGDPRTELEEAARSEHADLLVVGSHGRSGIRKLLLGSVASHVVSHAPCTVLVVKTPASSARKGERAGSEPASRSPALPV